MAEDYYKILGVSRDASQADIERAYRTLARKYHPDMNPDDKSAKKKFQEVQTAFDVLGDSGKREMYDRYGSSFESASRAGAHPGGAWPPQGGQGFEEVDFSQFFGDRFGGGAGGGGGANPFGDFFSQFTRGGQQGKRRGAKPAPARGPDLESSVEIPFGLAVSGGEIQLSLSRDGKNETITVKIPAGIDEGKKVRLRGQGQPAAPGGTAGDLLVVVHVAAHPWFTRKGDNLYVRLPITLREAAEGAKVDVPTPQGTVSLRVPPATSSGTRLRIKGHGVNAKGRTAGDLFAEVQVTLPHQLDAESLEMIKKIDAAHPSDPREQLRW